MAFQDRYKKEDFLLFILTYSIVTQRKIQRADRKDQGQKKQTELIIIAKMTAIEEREREPIIRPEKKHKRCHIDQQRCLFLLFRRKQQKKIIFFSDNYLDSLI
jgi:hypothetical protein